MNTPDSDPAVSLPCIRTDSCFTKIIQSLYSFYPQSSDSVISPERKFTWMKEYSVYTIKVSDIKKKKCDSCKDALETLPYD